MPYTSRISLRVRNTCVYPGFSAYLADLGIANPGKFFVFNTRQWFESHPLRQPPTSTQQSLCRAQCADGYLLEKLDGRRHASAAEPAIGSRRGDAQFNDVSSCKAPWISTARLRPSWTKKLNIHTRSSRRAGEPLTVILSECRLSTPDDALQMKALRSRRIDV